MKHLEILINNILQTQPITSVIDGLGTDEVDVVAMDRYLQLAVSSNTDVVVGRLVHYKLERSIRSYIGSDVKFEVVTAAACGSPAYGLVRSYRKGIPF